jgi:hypothetical protein
MLQGSAGEAAYYPPPWFFFNGSLGLRLLILTLH